MQLIKIMYEQINKFIIILRYTKLQVQRSYWRAGTSEKRNRPYRKS